MNFWTQLENQTITREQLPHSLYKKLGEPTNEVQSNLAQEIVKKIVSYFYSEEESANFTACSLIGTVLEISERIRKSGKRKGQLDYDLKLSTKETLQARKEDLTEEKWTQIENLALLGQNLVFKYRKWFNNKQIIDFYLQVKDLKSSGREKGK